MLARKLGDQSIHLGLRLRRVSRPASAVRCLPDNASRGGCGLPSKVNGHQTSTVSPCATGMIFVAGMLGAGGMTPTTVNGCASSVILRPMMFGSAAKRCATAGRSESPAVRCRGFQRAYRIPALARDEAEDAEVSGGHAKPVKRSGWPRARKLQVGAGDSRRAIRRSDCAPENRESRMD